MSEGTETPAVTPVIPTSPTAKTQSFRVMAADAVVANDAVNAMDKAVGKGKIHLDEGSAEALIKALQDARDQVQSLYDGVRPKLETPLKFGQNPVADAISAKFRDISVGEESSAVIVMEDLLYILRDVEETVQSAVSTTREADEESTYGMNKPNGAS